MRTPSVLVSYPGPDASGETQDVYLYLRPETNGVLTESVMMKTVMGNPEWKSSAKLVYLANLPGDFIQTRHIIEQHYLLKIRFAKRGGSAFTPAMKRQFEDKFSVPFNPKRILGAFQAMEALGISEEELFAFRVDDRDMLLCHGQNIKKRGDVWIVNYDIPAILHKNTFETDIAVMVFRISMNWNVFCNMIMEISRALSRAGVMEQNIPPSRVFHYSRSPFEQVLDGLGYLWGVDVSDGGVEDDVSFGRYLMDRGYERKAIRKAALSPLVLWRNPNGKEQEGNLFEMTAGASYQEALKTWSCVVRPLLLPDQGRDR